MGAVSASTTGNQQVTYQNSDGTTSVLSGGTPAWRNNNPGNLTYGSLSTAQANGAIGVDSNGRAIFPTAAAGDAAVRNLLSNKYGNYTINSMMSNYAPSYENDTVAYQKFLQNQLGVSGNTVVNTLTPQQFNVLVNSIEKWEGNIPGVISGPDPNANSLSPRGEAPASSDPVDVVYSDPGNTNLASFVDDTNGNVLGSYAFEADGSTVDTFNYTYGVVITNYSDSDTNFEITNPDGSSSNIQINDTSPTSVFVAPENGTVSALGSDNGADGNPNSAVVLGSDGTTLSGGSGEDVLVAAGSNVTVNGGTGSNQIFLNGNNDTATVNSGVISVAAGDTGSNVYGDNNTFNLGNGSNFTAWGDNNTVYEDGDGNVFGFGGNNENVYINNGSVFIDQDNNSVTVWGFNVTVYSGQSGDTVGFENNNGNVHFSNGTVNIDTGDESETAWGDNDTAWSSNSGDTIGFGGNTENAHISDGNVNLNGTNDGVTVWGNNDTAGSIWSGDTFGFAGTNENAYFSDGTVNVDQSDDSITVWGQYVTVNSSYSGDTFGFGGSNDTANLSDGTVNVDSSNESLTLNGTNISTNATDDTLFATGGSTLNLSGGDDLVVLDGNNYLGLLDGDGYNVYGSDSSIPTQNNAGLTVYGSDDVLSPGQNDYVAADGGGNMVYAQSGDDVVVDQTNDNPDQISGNGVNTTETAENGAQAGIYLDANDQAAVASYYDTIGLNTGDTLSLYGGGNTINTQNNDRVIISETYGSADAVNATNDQNNANAADGQTAGINVSSNAEADVTGGNNTVLLGSDDSVAVSGPGNVIDTNPGNLVFITNTGGDTDTVNGSNDQTGSFTETNQGTGIVVDANVFTGIVGSNDGVLGNSGDHVSVSGNNDDITVGSRSVVGISSGNSEIIYANGDNISLDDYVSATVVGSNDKINGYYDDVTVDGSDDPTVGGYDTLNASGSRDFSDGPDDTDLGTEYGEIDFSGGGGYGYYGIAAVNPGVFATGIDVVAQYDANSGYVQAATAAQAALTQAEQAAAGGFATSAATVSKQPTGAFWTDPTITWSFAPGSDTGAAPFSGAIDAQEQPIIEAAIETWEAASGLTFQQVSSDASPDVTIGWGDFATASSGVVAYTTANREGTWLLPGTVVRLEDPSETALTENASGQLTYSGTDVTLYQSALHEIGHALGLADDSDPNSVMYATLGPNNTTLDSTDIAAIQALYGPEGTGAAFFLQPPTTLTAAQATQAALAATASQTALLSPGVLN